MRKEHSVGTARDEQLVVEGHHGAGGLAMDGVMKLGGVHDLCRVCKAAQEQLVVVTRNDIELFAGADPSVERCVISVRMVVDRLFDPVWRLNPRDGERSGTFAALVPDVAVIVVAQLGFVHSNEVRVVGSAGDEIHRPWSLVFVLIIQAVFIVVFFRNTLLLGLLRWLHLLAIANTGVLGLELVANLEVDVLGLRRLQRNDVAVGEGDEAGAALSGPATRGSLARELTVANGL